MFRVTVDPAVAPSVTYVLDGSTVTANTNALPPSCDSLSKTGAAILDGSGPPTNAQGQDGDFYIDTNAHTVYGPKVGGLWPTSGVSLVGPQGQTGPQGGRGPQGIQGLQGPPGKPMCRNTALAKLVCEAIFRPGSWLTGPSAATARFTLRRGSVTYARGVARIHTGKPESFTLRLGESRHG